MDVRFSPMRAQGCTLQAGAHCSSGWQVNSPWHRHDMHQLLYAFEGSVEVEGQVGRYKVPRQFAAWIPAGAVHRTSIQKVASGSIFFTPDLVSSGGDSPRIVPAPALMREMVIYAMRWPLDRTDDPASSVYFKCLASLCDAWIKEDVKLVLPASTDQKTNLVMEFTRSNIATVTFRDVCRVTNMSERSLRRHFNRTAGVTWEEYRLRLRMWLAIEDLDRTTKPIGVIAADVGYDNPAAFAKAFRVMIGAGPSEYRRRNAIAR